MNKKNKIKVLFLSAWYPNRYDAMAGLFVRKHAEAVSLYCDVTVLYLHADKNIEKTEIVTQTINQNAREIIIYYPEKRNGIFRKFFKAINYFHANIIGYKKAIKTTGVPDIVHVNILTRTGLLAYWLKKTKNIPYVITEHWTRYLPSNNTYKGYFRKALTQVILKSSEAVMPVSNQLKDAMLMHGLKHANYKVINNVVDDFFYRMKSTEPKIISSKKRILHVSCFLEKAKNVKGLLNVVKSISNRREDFELIIIGYGPDYDEILKYTTELKIKPSIVSFIGEKTPEEVAYFFHQSDFFILFSNYETAGVVIAESLASGVPVVSTRVGIATDYINNGNGILVDVGDENAFANAIEFMLDHPEAFDRNKIYKDGEIFCFEVVGNDIFNIYDAILHR